MDDMEQMLQFYDKLANVFASHQFFDTQSTPQPHSSSFVAKNWAQFSRDFDFMQIICFNLLWHLYDVMPQSCQYMTGAGGSALILENKI